MKRGCRLGLVAPRSGRSLASGVLARLDPHAALVETADGDPNEPERSLRRLAETSGADAVALPLALDEYPSAKNAWGDRVVFSPTIAWSDDEVDARWDRVRALAG
jgi:hypothetical protein